MKPILFAAIAAAMLSSVADAAETDRYVLEKTADGYVRMDRLTGEMSLCALQGSELVCRVADDDRKSAPADVEALTRRVDALEKTVAALQGGAPAAGLPSDEEFEKAMGFMERFFKRFMEMVRGFEKENDTAPSKT